MNWEELLGITSVILLVTFVLSTFLKGESKMEFVELLGIILVTFLVTFIFAMAR